MIQSTELLVDVSQEPPWPTKLDPKQQQLDAQVLPPSLQPSTTTSGCQETHNRSHRRTHYTSHLSRH
jgi:hypothetical protein